MAVNFSELLYSPVQDTFARRVEITPIASQPGAPAYSARGRFSTKKEDIITPSGAVVNDQMTTLEIRSAEFPVPPIQLDRIQVLDDSDAGPSPGTFEVSDTFNNHKGKLILLLRRVV